MSAASWARAVRPFSRFEAHALQAACRRGFMGGQLPSADKWFLRPVSQGHAMDPDVRTAARLDSVLSVVLRDQGATSLAEALGLAACYRV
eukprot:746720-Alexandrium_andersonii.AAC.1